MSISGQTGDADGEPLLLWSYGDAWRNLTEEVRNQVVTVMAENGTVRVLNLADGWQQRVPIPDRHSLHLDGTRHSLTAVTWASPCGISVTGAGHYAWHITTAVIAVVAGDHPHWATTPADLALLEIRHDPVAQHNGHPEAACPVTYCIQNAPAV